MTRPAKAVSARQMQVLRLVANGRTNPEIAAELFIELTTVKSHLFRLYKTLGARNGPHAVAISCSRGWNPLGAAESPCCRAYLAEWLAVAATRVVAS